MKRFVVKLFFLSIALLLVCAAHVMIQILLSRGESERVFALGDDTKLIMLGASEIGCSFEKSDSFNCQVYWNSGSSLFFNRARISALATVNTGLGQVKYCVLALNPHCPAWYLNQARFSRNLCLLLPIVWRYYGELSWNEMLQTIVYVIQSGWGKCASIVEKVPGETLPWSQRPPFERAQYLQNEWRHHYSWLSLPEVDIGRVESMMERDISEVNDICKRYGVQLVVVATPHASDYWQGVPAEAMLRHKKWINAFERQGILYFDMMKTMPDDCFRDECHLLPSGAKKFTQLFEERINCRKAFRHLMNSMRSLPLPIAFTRPIRFSSSVFRPVMPKDWCMCFPYGSANPQSVAKAKSLGAILGFSTEVAIARIGQSDPMLLPRLDTNDFPPKSERYKDFIA